MKGNDKSTRMEIVCKMIRDFQVEYFFEDDFQMSVNKKGVTIDDSLLQKKKKEVLCAANLQILLVWEDDAFLSSGISKVCRGEELSLKAEGFNVES